MSGKRGHFANACQVFEDASLEQITKVAEMIATAESTFVWLGHRRDSSTWLDWTLPRGLQPAVGDRELQASRLRSIFPTGTPIAVHMPTRVEHNWDRFSPVLTDQSCKPVSETQTNDREIKAARALRNRDRGSVYDRYCLRRDGRSQTGSQCFRQWRRRIGRRCGLVSSCPR